MLIPDDPIIQSMERTGYPPWNKQKEPICPVCGQACQTVYKGCYHEIIGCDECLTAYDAWDEDECFTGYGE